MPRPMKTTRERRSSSGHSGRCSGGWTTCWTPLSTIGPSRADVQQALDAQHVLAARLQQHRQPDAEGGPVERLVEGQAQRAHLVRVRRRIVVVEVARIARRRRPKRADGATSPNTDSTIGAAGFSRRSCARHERGVGEVGLRDDEPVGDRRLAHRLVVAEPVLRVHGRHHGLEPVVVLDERRREERVDDRRRVREPGRLDDDATEGRDLARVAAGDQVAQLVGEVAAERAAQAAARQQHGALVDPAQQVVVDPDLAELVHDHCRLAHVRVRQEAGEQRGLAAAEEPGDERDGDLHSDATSSGSSGSSVRPASSSASTQREPRSATTAERPFASRRTQIAAAPVVEPQPVEGEHAVQEPHAEDAPAPAALLLGPVLVEEDVAQRRTSPFRSTTARIRFVLANNARRADGQGDLLLDRRRRGRGRGLARLVRRRGLSRRHLARRLRRRGRVRAGC